MSIPSRPMTPASRRYSSSDLLRAEVARFAAQLADDKAPQRQPAALDVFEIDAVVADQRVRHRDDLPAIGGVGEDLLVAGHARVEHDLAEDFPLRAKAGTGVDGAVGQRKFCREGHAFFCSRAPEQRKATVDCVCAPLLERLPLGSGFEHC